MKQEQILANIKRCPRSNECSANICPLDNETAFRRNLPNENRCPYTIDRKDKTEKGIRTLLPGALIDFIPIRNHKLLNRRTRKRYQELKNT